MAEAVDAVENAFADWGKHPEINLTRRRLHFGAARLNTMPGALPSRAEIGLRIQSEILAVQWRRPDLSVTESAGRPAVRHRERRPGGDHAVVDAPRSEQEGVPLRTSDLMTAAISAVGTKWMSRSDASELFCWGRASKRVITCSPWQAIRRFKRVMVFSPTRKPS